MLKTGETHPLPLESLLNPRGVAVVGASHEERRPGGQALHALTHYGYAGGVYAVNPRRGEVQGLRCYPSVKALPGPADLAVIALPAAEVPRVILECGEAGISNAIILSAGFREIGTAGVAPQAELEAALARSGVRAVGPNCVGMLNLKERVFAGFGAGFRQPQWRRGPLAVVSQSGGFAYSIIAFCQESGVGIDYMVSTGNEASLGVLDFVEHFLHDPAIRLVAVYLEGIRDGRRLRALGRDALRLGKPIAVWKVGNTSVGRRAAQSHTANLTEDYDFYRDAFAEGGFVEVREVYDLVDAARVFGIGKRPRGRGVAIVTTSGGAGVLLADRCQELGLELPALAPESVAKLAPLVPTFASLANPIDLTATLAQKEPEFTEATRVVAEDPHVDIAILRSFPGRDVRAWAAHLAEYARVCPKPLLVSLSGTPAESGEWAAMLSEAGVPCFEVPMRAAAATAMACSFAERATRAHGQVDARIVAREPLPLPEGGAALDEDEAKRCLEVYGIATARRSVLGVHEVEQPRLELRFPVVAKVLSPDITHKTEVGGVALSVAEADLTQTLRDMSERVRANAPHARVRGFLLEEMAEGVEVIVGAVDNPAFGPLVLVGLGGVHAEIFRDVARRYAPVGLAEAREMIASLKAAPLLEGHRGQPGVDIEALAQTIARLSLLALDHENRVDEIEINPLVVGRSGAVAVDAVVRLKPQLPPEGGRVK